MDAETKAEAKFVGDALKEQSRMIVTVGIAAIGVLVGARLIFTGWSMIAFGSSARGAIDEVESAIDASV